MYSFILVLLFFNYLTIIQTKLKKGGVYEDLQTHELYLYNNSVLNRFPSFHILESYNFTDKDITYILTSEIQSIPRGEDLVDLTPERRETYFVNIHPLFNSSSPLVVPNPFFPGSVGYLFFYLWYEPTKTNKSRILLEPGVNSIQLYSFRLILSDYSHTIQFHIWNNGRLINETSHTLNLFSWNSIEIELSKNQYRLKLNFDDNFIINLKPTIAGKVGRKPSSKTFIQFGSYFNLFQSLQRYFISNLEIGMNSKYNGSHIYPISLPWDVYIGYFAFSSKYNKNSIRSAIATSTIDTYIRPAISLDEPKSKFIELTSYLLMLPSMSINGVATFITEFSSKYSGEYDENKCNSFVEERKILLYDIYFIINRILSDCRSGMNTENEVVFLLGNLFNSYLLDFVDTQKCLDLPPIFIYNTTLSYSEYMYSNYVLFSTFYSDNEMLMILANLFYKGDDNVDWLPPMNYTEISYNRTDIFLIKPSLTYANYLFFLLASISVSYFNDANNKMPYGNTNLLRDEIKLGQTGEDDNLNQYYIKRAEDGDHNAQTFLGTKLYWGQGGFNRDIPRAINYFRQAAGAGNVDAMYNLGVILNQGIGDAPQDQAAAQYYFQRAADGGQVLALNALAAMELHNNHDKPNSTLILEYFEKSAKGGNLDAMFNLGQLNMQGKIIPQNMTAAIYWYGMAAIKGHPMAVYTIGHLYSLKESEMTKNEYNITLNIEGVSFPLRRDLRISTYFLQKISLLGEWKDYIDLSYKEYVKGNYTASYILYSYSAKMGYPVALLNCIYLLRKHNDILKLDDREITLLLVKAVQGEDIVSIRELGNIYYNGDSLIDVNKTSAYYLYNISATAGDIESIYNMIYYFEGHDEGGGKASIQEILNLYHKGEKIMLKQNKIPFPFLFCETKFFLYQFFFNGTNILPYYTNDNPFITKLLNISISNFTNTDDSDQTSPFKYIFRNYFSFIIGLLIILFFFRFRRN